MPSFIIIIYFVGYAIAAYLWARACFTRVNPGPDELQPGKLSIALLCGFTYGWFWPFWLVILAGGWLHDRYDSDLGYRIGVKLFGKGN